MNDVSWALDVVKSAERLVAAGLIDGIYATYDGRILAIAKSSVEVAALTGVSPEDVSVIELHTSALPAMPAATPTYCGFRCLNYRPLIAGIDVGAKRGSAVVAGGCTAGVPLADGFITANHCTASSVCGQLGGGASVTQPGPLCAADPEAVGRPYRWSMPDSSGIYSSDSVYVKTDVPVAPYVLDEGGRKVPVADYTEDPVLGQIVWKMGRGVDTFSTRSGIVLGYGVSRVACPLGGSYVLRGYIATYMASEGDSGAGVYIRRGDAAVPAGIIAGGSDTFTVFSPISAVLKDLGLASSVPHIEAGYEWFAPVLSATILTGTLIAARRERKHGRV